MNFDLATKLKKAGFPQRGKGELIDLIFPDGETSNEPVYIPTLEELINEIVKKDRVFALIYDFKNKYIGWGYKCISEGIKTEGKEADEVVANLWLELNKK